MWSVVLLGTALAAGPLAAQQRELNWAEKTFSTLSVDFGTIARGADVYQYVTIENLYQETLTLSSVGTSCSCAQAKIDKKTLKTHEKATIELKMDTLNHTGKKNSNLDVTMTFDNIHFKSVRVPIAAHIRTDVVITPEQAGFGNVMWGTGAEKLLDVAYAGRNSWRLLGVRSSSEFITAEVREVARAAGSVRYQVVLRLHPNAPVGTMIERLTLQTDDTSAPEFPVSVTARIEPDIIASPAVVPFGRLAPGTEKTIPVVLKSGRPFEIGQIECDSALNCFKMRESSGAKTVHVIPLTITAPNQPGEHEEIFTVTVPGRPEPFQFRAQFNVTGS